MKTKAASGKVQVCLRAYQISAPFLKTVRRIRNSQSVQQDHVYRADNFVFDLVLIHTDLLDLLRVNERVQLLAHTLKEDNYSVDLYSAARTARAGADEHYQNDYRSGKLRPEVEIDRRKAR